MAKFTEEQLQAVEHKDGNILISASAGSGKTHTMISRLVRLVMEENIDVNQILAVTFTEKSAFDMKEKLKNAFMKAQNVDKARLHKQLALVPTCDISTLHAFCARLIRLYFYEVGLSPDFAVADDVVAGNLRKTAIDKTFKELYDEGEEWFYTLIDRLAVSRSDAGLKDLVTSTYTFVNSEKDPNVLLNQYQAEYSAQNFEVLLEKYFNLLKAQLPQIEQDLLNAYTIVQKIGPKAGEDFTKTLLTDVQILLQAKDVYITKAPLEGLSRTFNFGKNLTEEQIYPREIVRECRNKLKKIIERFTKYLTDRETDFSCLQSVCRDTEHFVSIVKRFASNYDAEKRDENVLDFADLEHFALKIIENPKIIEQLRKKYKYVFVDEYQDINGVQESIINLISNDNLFMVGDLKQSIYGFRGCRPDFFANKLITMNEKGEKVLSLNHNFRSAKAIIDMVNKVFCYSMTKDYFETEYKGNAELISGGVYPEDKEGRATLHVLEKGEKEAKEPEAPRVYNVLQEIKKGVTFKDDHNASLITELINQELGKTYYDFKSESDKQITYSDIAILTREKRTGYVQKLVKGLMMHGVPVISEVKENVCDYPEIKMIINVLRLVDNSKQDIPLASTLLSPIANFTNDDLAKIVSEYSHTESAKQNKNWSFINAYNYYLKNGKDSLSQRLLEFDNYIKGLTFTSQFIGAEGVLNKLIDEKDLESYFLARHNGTKKVDLLNRFVFASVEGDKKLTLQEFLHKIDNSSDAFAFAESQQEDAVNVMTIHASKGLEFPVVIVCGLEKPMKLEEKESDLFLSREYGLAFKYFDDQKRKKSETLLRAVMQEQNRVNNVREELRLFYVALTRATYSLHLICEGEMKERAETFAGAERFIDYIPNSIPAIMHSPDDFAFTELKSDTRKIIIGQSDDQIVAQMQERFAKKYPFEMDTSLPLKLGVTTVSSSDSENLVHLIFDEPTPDIEKGIIAHKVMEHYDFNSQIGLESQVENMIKSNILSAEEVQKINLERIEKAIKSGVFDDVKGTKLYREKVFFTCVDADMVLDTNSKEQIVLQGVMDLLSIADDGAIIIDYKYSSLDSASLKTKYHKQLELYAYATKKVLNKKVKKMVIVNLFTGEVVLL